MQVLRAHALMAYLDKVSSTAARRASSKATLRSRAGAPKIALASCKTLAAVILASHGTAPKLSHRPGRLRDSVGARRVIDDARCPLVLAP